jgi:hypothetical protein
LPPPLTSARVSVDCVPWRWFNAENLLVYFNFADFLAGHI